MNKTKLIAATAIAAGIAVVGTRQYNALVTEVQERFPEIDPKIVRKAYRNFMLKALTGQTIDLQNLSDDAMDTLFRVEVFNLIAKK